MIPINVYTHSNLWFKFIYHFSKISVHEIIQERKTWRIEIPANESTPGHCGLICRPPAPQSFARTEFPIIFLTGPDAGTILNPTDFSLTEDIVSP